MHVRGDHISYDVHSHDLVGWYNVWVTNLVWESLFILGKMNFQAARIISFGLMFFQKAILVKLKAL